MSAEVVVICPELSPGSGGVGDYTLRVVEQWRGLGPRFLVAREGESGTDFQVEELDAGAALRRQLPRSGRILLQYSAYGFQRFGYPRELLRALVDWKRQAPGVLVVMFHEIWTFWPLLNKNYALQWLHRRDIGKLLKVADAVFTSTSSQAEHLRALGSHRDVEVLPVGSNIRRILLNDGTREEGAAVLFGLQGSRITALRRTRSELKTLAQSGRLTKLIAIGGGNTREGDRHERELAADFQLHDGAEMRGALSEEEVSAELSRSSFGISVQDELSVTKSGSFMAYASHGLNILSPHAGADRTPPLSWATHPDELRRGLSGDELKSRGEHLRDWQERTCSWPRIAERFASTLQLDINSRHPAEPIAS